MQRVQMRGRRTAGNLLFCGSTPASEQQATCSSAGEARPPSSRQPARRRARRIKPGGRRDARRRSALSTTQHLESLEKRALIHRHFSFGDTRAVAFSLTDAGAQLLEAGRPVVRDLELQLLNRLGGRNGGQLLKLLEQTRRTLHLARRMKLQTTVEWDPLPDRLADMYTENGFEPFPRPR